MDSGQKPKHPEKIDELTRRRFLQTSTVALAGATLFPQDTLAEPQADASMPAGVTLNWDTANVVTVNAKRSRASLDGTWLFTPAIAGEADAPKTGWAYIKVPGSWGSQSRRSAPSDLVSVGNGPQWAEYDGDHVASAWYEREVFIPSNWQGRVISLRFDRVCTDAIVYVNGAECGRVPWPWGSVDITEAVVPGKTARLRVQVAAIADSQMVGHFWQNAFMAVTYSAAKLATRGLTGSVYLECRSSAAHISDVFIRTSTRKGNVALDVDLSGVTRAGQVHLVAEMLNEKGELEKSFTESSVVGRRPAEPIYSATDPEWCWNR
jgi:beta-galactosidase